ncbi:MAG: Membrane lipoprotein TmpC [Candidatus Dichloromethanomonas elyunquensis]|nr:MAG: Membrane lipoprotein TmpC [Candidatus Dichloromethanomonas elyunquensis]
MSKKNKKDFFKDIVALSAAVVLIVNMLAGCSVVERITGQTPTGDFGSNIPRIGLITGEGGVTDPYYQKAWDGMQEAQRELQAGIGYVKIKSDKDYPSRLTELSEDNCEMIVTLGQNAVSAVADAAKKNPKITYICLDGSLDSPIPANVLGVSYKIEEAAFLAGILTGKMTKSKVVGFISGDNSEASQRYFYGFKSGLRTVDSSSELLKGLAGTFTDKARVEKIAVRMINSQADVVFNVAGTAGNSIIKVMNQYGKYAIGSDLDQNYLAPKRVMTSVIKYNDKVLLDIIKKFKDKQLVLGKNNIYGLAEEGVGLGETTKNMVSDELYEKIIQYQENIISGKIKVPADENTYFEYLDN